MADPVPTPTETAAPAIEIADLHVYYGHAHALQGVSLTLPSGVLGVVGRNGMGKTTLCNAIMGLVPASAGNIRLAGIQILGLPPNEIVNMGVGYVPQGRRVWPSLTVDEHLRLVGKGSKGPWTVERIYQTFPRLAERRRNGGAQLSGGEQQMLAISRGLLGNPRLLVMDEPTEGLAPVIVDQVVEMLTRLAEEGAISVLLIEQNLGVATTVASRVAVMVNGRILREMPAHELANDHELQQRLLGVRTREEDVEAPMAEMAPEAPESFVFQVRRAAAEEGEAALPPPPPVVQVARAPTLWSQGNPLRARALEAESESAAAEPEAMTDRAPAAMTVTVAKLIGRAAYIAGTFDTKGRELTFIRNCLEKLASAPSPSISAPARSPRPRIWARRRWRDSIPRGRPPSSAATGVRRSPPWPKPSSASSARAAT